MKEFDAIIGYREIKRELEQTADILKNVERYKQSGAKLPSGMLIHGAPGLGKSLMAESLIKAAGLPSFTVRKDKSDGEFIDFIKDTFEEAAMAAPSIVYLDDMDKFSNTDRDHKNAEEFVAVQACIDSVKGKDVFVLATTNEIECLPVSLLRAGRFDRKIEVYPPVGQDAAGIITSFLKGKPLADDVVWDDIAMLMGRCSCAELESTLNEALLISISKGEELVSKDSFMQAYFKTHVKPTSGGIDFSDGLTPSERRQHAMHEAGHVAVYEVLVGKAVSLATVFKSTDGRSGICREYMPADCPFDRWSEVHTMAGLGGRAAMEVFFEIADKGCGEDLRKVSSIVTQWIHCAAVSGSPLFVPFPHVASNDQKRQEEQLADAEMERMYRKVKNLLLANREFVEKLADAIAEREYLVSSDIQAIRDSCEIVKEGSWC